MTGASRGELEVNDLFEADGAGDADAGVVLARQWVREFLERRLEGGLELDLTTPDDAETAAVCILDAGPLVFYAPAHSVPSWINVERDLPVEGDAP